jgi:hypothetical protein
VTQAAKRLHSQQSRMEGGGSTIAIFYPLSSILNYFDTWTLPLITGPANQWADTDNAEKQLVNGNLVRRSDLAKRACQQQVEKKPAQAGENKKTE